MWWVGGGGGGGGGGKGSCKVMKLERECVFWGRNTGGNRKGVGEGGFLLCWWGNPKGFVSKGFRVFGSVRKEAGLTKQ